MIRNLAKDKKVEITAFVPTENTFAYEEKGSKDMLTNGETADPSKRFGGGWAHFAYGFGRTLFVDLGEIFSVSGFDIGFIHDREAASCCPEDVRLLLSENGVDYYNVLTVSAPYPASFTMQARAVYRGELKMPARARYAKIVFGVEMHAFCDELRIFGSDSDGFEQPLSGTPYAISEKFSYASRDSLGGVCDIPTLYYGRKLLPSTDHRISGEEFLPYLAYIDRNGSIADRMFDSVLLAPYMNAPSGGSFTQMGTETDLSDWEWLIDELFAPERNLKALDAAVEELKKILALPRDYKHKLYLTAPVPKISLKPFGDLNGDGIEEKLITTDDCVSAYCWFVDNVARRFNAQCFCNIQIDGWCWGTNLSRYYRDDEEVFASKCVSELHKRGYKCLLTAWNQGANIYKAESVGFDCVSMNHDIVLCAALQENISGAMSDLAACCKKYGLGIYMEMHYGHTPDESQKNTEVFEECLRECMRNGIMTETVHVYPDLIRDLSWLADGRFRRMYDKLYKFIKGTLSESDFEPSFAEPTVIEETVFEEPVSEVCLPEREFSEPESIDIVDNITEEINGETAEEPERNVEETKTEIKPDLALEVAVSVEIKTPETVIETKIETPADESNPKTESKAPKNVNRPKPANKKSYAALGAGIAAATLGILYLIKKASDEK